MEVCDERQLLGTDLSLAVISPSRSVGHSEPRFRCPVEGCSFLGTTVNHPSDCLKHILDPKQDVAAHSRFLSKRLVTFRTAEGKPALHSRPSVPAAFSYSSASGAVQHAYMKVCQASTDLLLLCWLASAAEIPVYRLAAVAAVKTASGHRYRHVHAVQEDSARLTTQKRH